MKTLAEWLRRLEEQHPRSIELGLERVASVYERIGTGKPANQVISVAGTNGKGSTVAYIDAIATAAGWRCGRYTSPHLIQFNERIVIDGVAVSDRELCNVFAEIDEALGPTSLTYFEFTTLAAFVLFSRSSLDLAVLEVGLGGRLDAVNIIDPDVAVITSIGIDHEDWLGNDRELIGFEKAGIMRAGTTVICAERDVPKSVNKHAANLGARIQLIGKHFDWPEPLPAMMGSAQRDNFAGALAALKALPEPPEPLSAEVITTGAAISIPGRFQKFQSSPDVYVDVAHNVQAAEQLATCIGQCPCPGKRRFILAMLEDKQVGLVAASLDELASRWYLAGLEGPRGLSAQELQSRLAGYVETPVSSCDSVTDAIQQAMLEADEWDQVLIFGSFLTVAEAFRYWKR